MEGRSMADMDTIAEAKRRYETLFAQGRNRQTKAKPAGNPAKLDKHAIVDTTLLPGGWGVDVRVPRGQTLRLVNLSTTAGVSVLLYNAHDVTERFNAGDTVKIQWNANLGKGSLLYSDMGRVLASITDDTYGHNDALAGGSTKTTNVEKYACRTLRNTRDNFILLAAKHGMSKVDVPPCITLFAPVSVTDRGQFQWRSPEAKAGDYVDLRAEMDLLVFVSNCPHPLSPGGYNPKDIELIFWRSPPAAADDYCRKSCEEAVRGFENTDRICG
jgi:urea carboxylase-associated protein 2